MEEFYAEHQWYCRSLAVKFLKKKLHGGFADDDLTSELENELILNLTLRKTLEQFQPHAESTAAHFFGWVKRACLNCYLTLRAAQHTKNRDVPTVSIVTGKEFRSQYRNGDDSQGTISEEVISEDDTHRLYDKIFVTEFREYIAAKEPRLLAVIDGIMEGTPANEVPFEGSDGSGGYGPRLLRRHAKKFLRIRQKKKTE